MQKESQMKAIKVTCETCGFCTSGLDWTELVTFEPSGAEGAHQEVCKSCTSTELKWENKENSNEK